jgi:transposase InsO family protein
MRFVEAGAAADPLANLLCDSPRRSQATGSCSRSGSVGVAYDNAMAERFVDSFKTELLTDRVWVSLQALELAIVEYVGWFNLDRLHESLGDLPPAEFEAFYAPQTETTITL